MTPPTIAPTLVLVAGAELESPSIRDCEIRIEGGQGEDAHQCSRQQSGYPTRHGKVRLIETVSVRRTMLDGCRSCMTYVLDDELVEEAVSLEAPEEYTRK